MNRKTPNTENTENANYPSSFKLTHFHQLTDERMKAIQKLTHSLNPSSRLQAGIHFPARLCLLESRRVVSELQASSGVRAEQQLQDYRRATVKVNCMF
jgi:hypothetical protein